MRIETHVEKKPDGLTEGLARAVTQACVYAIEARKTMVQVYTHAAPMTFDPWRFLTGALTSASSAGLIFGMYFYIYNNLNGHPLASPIASTCVSIIKQPISNSIRLMQAGVAPNIFKASRRIFFAHGVGGLYNGYFVSLCEDMIEWDVRARLYDRMHRIPHALPPEVAGAAFGALSGILAAWITTPFDTIKTSMAMMAARNHSHQGFLQVTFSLFQKGGIPTFYRGANYRAISSGLKFALFYSIVEAKKKP
jgi:hypothetical protein